MTIAALVLLVGYILESLMHMRQEQTRLVHLSYPAPVRTPRYAARGAGTGPVPVRKTADGP